MNEASSTHDPHSSAVIRYYDMHPINEEGILAELAARGVDPEAPTQDQLAEFDHDHYGGVLELAYAAHCAYHA